MNTIASDRKLKRTWGQISTISASVGRNREMKYLNRVLAYCGVGIHEAVDDLREYLVVHGDNLQVCDEKFALKMMELGRLVD